MPTKEKLNLAVTAGTVDIWRATAAELGYIATGGGPMQGQGSPSKLFDALVNSELDPERLSQAIWKVQMTNYRVRMTKAADEPPEEVKHEK